MLKSIQIRNLLSFGPNSEPFELRPLNVLIGPNGSGKSNLIEVLALLRALPNGLPLALQSYDWSNYWIWRGCADSVATVSVDLSASNRKMRYEFALSEGLGSGALLKKERVASLDDNGVETHCDFDKPHLYTNGASQRLLESEVESNASILALRRDPLQFPVLDDVLKSLQSFHIYRDWTFGPRSAPRQWITESRRDSLYEDFSNIDGALALVRENLIPHFRNLYSGIEGVSSFLEFGHTLMYVVEKGFQVPATNLSDGTLRYLALLAILLDPHPPAVICLEEPELGLHPDVVVAVADLLKQASARTQLIVTTHSTMLVDALSESPEDVVVCEKQDDSTVMRRLVPEELQDWLKEYGLGELWSRGQLGGNRW